MTRAASTQAAYPQRLVPVDQVVDLRPLPQRGFLHEAHQCISMGLRLGCDSRSLASSEPVGERGQLHAVADDFAVYLGGFEHDEQFAAAGTFRQREAG